MTDSHGRAALREETQTRGASGAVAMAGQTSVLRNGEVTGKAAKNVPVESRQGYGTLS